MKLIQMLLPVPREGETSPALEVTRAELVETFGGVTAYVRSPARGVWTDDRGHESHDDVIMVEVVTAEFNRAWWRAFAARVAVRLGQDTMHVRALTIDLLDDEGR